MRYSFSSVFQWYYLTSQGSPSVTQCLCPVKTFQDDSSFEVCSVSSCDVIFGTVFVMYAHILGLFNIAELQPFRKELLVQFYICSRCVLSICCYNYFLFWFR